jgi:dTDP-4-dehydrorhamnose 3,5-epimerase
VTSIRVAETPLSGMVVAESTIWADSRGQFIRLFCVKDLDAAHRGRPILQINLSVTAKVGALRGMHFQRPPHAEGKWIRCLSGRVFDVGVDLRRGSQTFLHWHGVELDAAKANAVFLPEGFAHGFQVLEPHSTLLYLHTALYAPDYEEGLSHADPRLGIEWPLPMTDVSDRDMNHPPLGDTFEGLEC